MKILLDFFFENNYFVIFYNYYNIGLDISINIIVILILILYINFYWLGIESYCIKIKVISNLEI